MKGLRSTSKVLIFVFCILPVFTLYGQDWEKSFGGILQEQGYSAQQTHDSGFIMVGSTNSFGAGLSDIYLIKADAQGDTMWSKTYGGMYADKGLSVRQTRDGGYIIGCEATITVGVSEDLELIKVRIAVLLFKPLTMDFVLPAIPAILEAAMLICLLLKQISMVTLFGLRDMVDLILS
jgi:hypothetical protein